MPPNWLGVLGYLLYIYLTWLEMLPFYHWLVPTQLGGTGVLVVVRVGDGVLAHVGAEAGGNALGRGGPRLGPRVSPRRWYRI